MISVAVVEPRKQENIGAIARVMANFGFSELVLVDPKCKKGVLASKVAKHGLPVLKKAKSMSFAALRKKYDTLVGTSAILGTDYNVTRSPLSPKVLGQKLQKQTKKAKTCIVIGREGSGLTNDEIKTCDFLVTIPASTQYPTLNVSQATTILLYELFQALSEKTHVSHITPASSKDMEILLKHFNSILKDLEFQTKEKKQTQQIVWKRLFGKAMLSKREAFAVMGLLRKLQK